MQECCWRVTAMPRDAPSEVESCGPYLLPRAEPPRGQVIADPAGQLRHLEAHSSPRFEQPDAAGERIEDVLTRVTRRLSALDPQAPRHEQVIARLFPASLPTRAPLVALLQTPPRDGGPWVAARAVLTQHGDERLYRSLLELLAALTSARRSWSSTWTTWPSRSTRRPRWPALPVRSPPTSPRWRALSPSPAARSEETRAAGGRRMNYGIGRIRALARVTGDTTAVHPRVGRSTPSLCDSCPGERGPHRGLGR
jgi:hypothetical protein